MADEETQTVEEKTDEKTTEEKPEYTKEQQERDQEKANAERARQERDEAKTQLETLQMDKAVLVAQLEELREKVEAQKSKSDEIQLDTDVVDSSVIKAIGQITESIGKLNEKISSIDKKTAAAEKAEKDRLAQTEREAMIERVIQTTEELGGFSTKYRNEAIKRADELVDSGKEKKPNDAAEGIKLLTKCYKQVIAEKEPKEKPSSRTDTGGGGVGFESATKGKEGTRQEVLADMKKHPGSWKKSEE